MENEYTTISASVKLSIWLNWTLKILGIALILISVAHWKGYPTPFKSLEAMQIEDRLIDLSMAMSAAQDDILEMHKGRKK
jgi:hypothetical protein